MERESHKGSRTPPCLLLMLKPGTQVHLMLVPFTISGTFLLLCDPPLGVRVAAALRDFLLRGFFSSYAEA